MVRDKILPITKGIIKSIPGMEYILHKRPGSTYNSRYCYSVWMRHLVNAWHNGMKKIPENVAELGPGGSLGVGLTALLSGSKKYFGLDVVDNWNLEMNLSVFDELVELFRNREKIPDSKEFPKINSVLSNYQFPSNIINEQVLKYTLSEDRINQIKEELKSVKEKSNQIICYIVPWNAIDTISDQTVDFLFSQAVLEHVHNPHQVYESMYHWLKPGAYMSHEIDLKSHGTSTLWNGHWMYSDFEWKLVRGRYKYLINRLPYTSHIRHHNDVGFQIINQYLNKYESKLNIKALSTKFRNLNDDELTTSAMFIQSIKPY